MSLRRWILPAVFLISPATFAQQPVIPVWPGVAPGSETWTQKEIEYPNPRTKEKMVRNIVTPTLTAFLPDRSAANGTAVIVCPGGGFRFLSWDSEGTLVAQWLAARGVAAFVLKYRVMATPAPEEEFQKAMAVFFARINSPRTPGTSENRPERDPAMQSILALAAADGKQAVKLVRQRAPEWGIASDRIGIMGFSAGAMVTMGVVMEHDADSRPYFAAPIYGGNVNGRPIPADAPPLFILVADDDRLMSVSSLKLYSDWKSANLPVELHVFAKGGHGFGLTKHNLPVDHWIDIFGWWLEGEGLLKSTKLTSQR